MAQSTLTFRFDYSEDGGTVWKETTPVAFSVVDWDVKIVNEQIVEHVLDADNEIVSYEANRVRLRIVVDIPNFYPSVDSNNANYVWLQKWRSKPLLRVSHTTGVKLDGLDLWATNTNTNYVTCEPDAEAEKLNSNWRKLELILTLKKTIT